MITALFVLMIFLGLGTGVCAGCTVAFAKRFQKTQTPEDRKRLIILAAADFILIVLNATTFSVYRIVSAISA